MKGELLVESPDGAEDVLLAPSVLELLAAGATLVVTVVVLESLLLAAVALVPEAAKADVDVDAADALVVVVEIIVLIDDEPEIVVVRSIVTGNTSVTVDPSCVVVTVAVDTDCEGGSVD